MSVQYGDIEHLVKTWVRDLPEVVALVPLPDGSGPAIFNAMPKGAPVTAIICRLITGGPTAGNDIPLAQWRFSFSITAATKAAAADIAYALIENAEDLARNGVWSDGFTTLYSAKILTVRWQPDPDSDTPRYIVDALITTVT